MSHTFKIADQEVTGFKCPNDDVKCITGYAAFVETVENMHDLFYFKNVNNQDSSSSTDLSLRVDQRTLDPNFNEVWQQKYETDTFDSTVGIKNLSSGDYDWICRKTESGNVECKMSSNSKEIATKANFGQNCS